MSGRRALVIGAGVSGLSCAVRLLEAGRAVTIRARELPPRTTSDVAGAFWYPYRAYPRDRVLGWAATSYRVFATLADDDATGVRMRPALEVFRAPAPDPWWGPAVPGWRRAGSDELPAGYADGYAFSAPVIDTRRYLPWLLGLVGSLGGALETATVASLDDALAAHELVVDCAGLGARRLAGDRLLVPIRGEVVHVHDPGLDRVLVDHGRPGEIAYVIPRGDDCVLGGSAEEGSEELASRPAEVAAIRRRCGELEPRVATAPRVGGAVGLRPGRPTVRLEVERPAPGRLLIHDYGHGGAGVTLSWGCAAEVAELARAG